MRLSAIFSTGVMRPKRWSSSSFHCSSTEGGAATTMRRTRCRMSPVNVVDVYNPRHEQFKDLYLVEKLSSNEGWIPASPEEGWSLGYGHELRNFIHAIRTGTPPESDLDLAIDTTLALYAGYVSADRLGQETAVPRID